MATILDAFGTLQNFSTIFTFLFIFILLYGILSYIKFLGDNKGLNAILAFSAAILFTLFGPLVRIFEYAAPWFVMLIVFIVMLMLVFRFLGASELDITNVLKTHTIIITFVFAFIIIILVFATGQVYSETPAGNDTMLAFPAKIGHILQHPNIIGMIAILFIAIFAIRLLAEQR